MMKDCPKCHGNKTILAPAQFADAGEQTDIPCDHCNGTGKVPHNNNLTLSEAGQLQERFQPFLVKNDYTFIAPSNRKYFVDFILKASNAIDGWTLANVFSNQEAVKNFLQELAITKGLTLYVALGEAPDNLMHCPLEKYMQRNNIKFEM